MITVDSSHSFSSPLCFITKFLLNEVKCKRKVPKYIENFVKYVNEHIGIYEHNNNKDDVFPPWFEDYVKSAIEQDKHDDKNKLMNP